MVILENELLRVEIAYAGAQLTSVVNKQAAIDYLWEGNPKYWGRHAPILFPIVGSLADKTYFYQGKAYTLPQHGFARDHVFQLVATTQNSVHFRLSDSEATRELYPFAFHLDVMYTLQAETLTIDWRVVNPSDETLYFSLGGHPAFSTKLFPTDQFTDYVLEFNQPEDLTAMLLDPQKGLFSGEVAEVAEDLEGLPLHYDLFVNDALVFNNFQGEAMTLRCVNHEHGLTYRFAGFPYVALWTPPGKEAPFICIEPWYGHADTIEGPFELSQKPGIQTLDGKQTFAAQQVLTFF